MNHIKENDESEQPLHRLKMRPWYICNLYPSFNPIAISKKIVSDWYSESVNLRSLFRRAAMMPNRKANTIGERRLRKAELRSIGNF
jgi:hypothetical protein